MILRFVAIFLFMLIASCASVKKSNYVSCEIINVGVFERIGKPDYINSENTAAGYTSSGDMKFVEQKKSIKIKKGLGFGFDYKLHNLNALSSKEIEVTALHPPIKNSSNSSSTKKSTDVWKIYPLNGSYENSFVYWLTEEREMVEGKWVLEIRHEGKKIASQEFWLKK